MRIRVGALKGYMCRVVRVHHSGALVRLDSSGKLMKGKINKLFFYLLIYEHFYNFKFSCS